MPSSAGDLFYRVSGGILPSHRDIRRLRAGVENFERVSEEFLNILPVAGENNNNHHNNHIHRPRRSVLSRKPPTYAPLKKLELPQWSEDDPVVF